VKKLIPLFCLLLLIVGVSINATSDASDRIAKALDFRSGHLPGHHCNLCGGYYAQPSAIANTPNPPPYNTTAITITATGPVIFRANGTSVMEDNIVVTQPGRLIHADKAIIYRDKRSGKITDIQLIGHVRIQENNKLLVGKKANYNIAKNTLSLDDALYHLKGMHEMTTVTTSFDAWGTAKSIQRQGDGTIDLQDGQYTTCPPKNPSWILSAKELKLDHAKGEGYAKDAVLRFKKVPILYVPYYSFPLNAKRKSGFLAPTMGYATQDGFYVGEPYYLNLAPNYDLLLTPQWYSDRGLQLSSTFRYLTRQSDGFFYLNFLPNDQKFGRFQRNALNIFSGNTSPTLQPYLSELSTKSNRRLFLNVENHVEFNDYWSGKFYARYLSDPYYPKDFQSQYLSQTTNQLPSFAKLNYARNHWEDTFLIQTYQTLHPLNQFGTPAQNQYSRLPELDFHAAYPQLIKNIDFDFSGQAVKFIYHSDFAPYTYQLPVGNRIHLRPSFSHSFTWPSAYVTPQLTADSTAYFSRLATANANMTRPEYNADRTLPIFDIDSGLYFDRTTHFGHGDYIQTLEPRIFYLYTPYKNQNSLPNFDTQLLPFSISDLYSLNSFSGFDRMQNANQVTLGLTSHLLRASNADDILSAQLGMIDYFAKQRVCLTQGCQPVSQSTSPIAGALTWNPNLLWSINSQMAWSTELDQINNAQAGVEYHLSQKHIIILNYQFTHGNPNTPVDAFSSTNTSLITAGLLWPITGRWDLFGYTYYNLTNNRPQNEYAGLTYSTCCWSTRFVISNDYNGVSQINGSPSFQNQYAKTYYVEFLLKGMGSAGNRRAEDMLTSTLPGFEDAFTSKGHYRLNQTM
jgi:LPS-assembly protein